MKTLKPRSWFIFASCLLGATGLTAWSTFTFASTRVQPALELEPMDLSIIQLIATPERYDGKFVRVVGFVRLEFEGNVIYLHQEDLTYRLTTNGLWLRISDEIEKHADKYNDKYVLVEGIFNARDERSSRDEQRLNRGHQTHGRVGR